MITYQMVRGVVLLAVGVNTHSRHPKTHTHVRTTHTFPLRFTPHRTTGHWCTLCELRELFFFGTFFENLWKLPRLSQIGTDTKLKVVKSPWPSTATLFLHQGRGVDADSNRLHLAVPSIQPTLLHHHYNLPPCRSREGQMPARSGRPWHPLPSCSLMALGWNVRPISSSRSDI